VVSDHLNISRIELGTLEFESVRLDFKKMVEGVISELKPNVDKAGLAFSFNSDNTGSFEIIGDEDKLKQVVANMFDNATKYTPSGSISATLVHTDNAKKIRFSVKDTGVGIDPRVMPKLFEKFSRAENASSVNIRGAGLGLYIAKEIINAHKGKIWAESEGEGKGSTFMVELPVA